MESWNLAQNADLEHSATSGSLAPRPLPHPRSSPVSVAGIPLGKVLLVARTNFLTTKFRGHMGDV